MLTRRQFIGAAVGAAAAAGAAGSGVGMSAEAQNLKLTGYELALGSLPAGLDGLRIVSLSDFHGKRFDDESALPGLIARCAPDLIALPGDLLDRHHPEALPKALDLVDLCVAAAPTCYVPGNHENGLANREDVYRAVAEHGARVLIYDQELVECRNGSLVVSGVPDPVAAGDWAGGVKSLARAEDALPDGGRRPFSILLSHRPERFAAYVEAGFDLVLSGHSHAGQICLPGGIPLYIPNQSPPYRYVKGVYQERGTTMVVSAGLGETGVGLRAFCPPEVVLVTLRSAGADG